MGACTLAIVAVAILAPLFFWRHLVRVYFRIRTKGYRSPLVYPVFLVLGVYAVLNPFYVMEAWERMAEADLLPLRSECIDAISAALLYCAPLAAIAIATSAIARRLSTRRIYGTRRIIFPWKIAGIGLSVLIPVMFLLEWLIGLKPYAERFKRS